MMDHSEEKPPPLNITPPNPNSYVMPVSTLIEPDYEIPHSKMPVSTLIEPDYEIPHPKNIDQNIDSINFTQNPLLDDKKDSEEKKVDLNGEDNRSEKDSAEEHSNTLLKKRKICGLIEGCDSIENYFYLNKIHEGVYGIVFRAKDKITSDIYAIKKVKLNKDNKEGFPITSIREINILLSLKHPNIVNLKEVAVGSTLDKIYVVMEYMEHELKDLMDHTKYSFSQSEIKCLIKQLLEGMAYLQSKQYMHRDLKTSNLLYNNKGYLKICDFGLARKLSNQAKAYTATVVTLWYRAPEILLGCDKYSQSIDMWSVGCIFAEILLKQPLIQGKSETEQLDLIFRLMGTPNEKNWPDWKNLKYARNLQFNQYIGNRLHEKFPKTIISEKGLNLLEEMLMLDPNKRISASKALNHEWFKESPPPQSLELMPTFPSRNEAPRELKKVKFNKD